MKGISIGWSVPAAKTADALHELFRAEGQAVPSAAARSVVIVPEIRSNSLILAGPPDAVEEVRQLAMQLDHTALLVHLEVLIAEAPTAPKEGESPQTRKIETFKVATELSVADRQTVVLGGAARTPNSGIERVLLVTPWIQPVGGRKVSVR